MERFVMRRIAILAAAVGGLAVTSSSFAALTFSTARQTGLAGGLDRVVLYALSDNAADQLLGADLTITSPANLVFAPASVNGDGVLQVGVRAPNLLTATNSRGSNAVFQTIAPGFPLPSDLSADDVTPPDLASGNVKNFQIVGFDGRAEPTRGTNAGAAINGGLGAAVFAAVVPTGAAVTFTGKIGTEASISGNVNETNTGVIVSAPAFSAGTLGGSDARQSLATTGDNPTIYTLTVDFGNLASVPASFSIDTNMTESGSIASVGALPSGITAAASGDVISGTIDGVLRGTYDIALTGSGNPADTATLRIVAIPEPATLSVLAGVGLLALRRRK